MKSRFVMILTALMLLTLGAMVGAQDSSEVFCGDLSADDCALLQRSSENYPESTRFEGNIVMDVVSMEDNINLTMDMSGGYAVDRAAMDAFAAYVEGLDVDALTADPTTFDVTGFIEQLGTVIGAADADLAFNMQLPPELDDGSMPNPLTVNLWFVDGVAYVDLAPFSMFDPTFDGVYGIDTNEALMMASAFITPDMLAEFGSGDIEMLMEQAGVDQTPVDPALIGNFATVTRLDDVGGLAVFSTSMDIVGMLQDPEMRAYIIENSDTQDLTVEETDAVLTAFSESLTSSAMTVTTRIDPATEYGVSVNFNLGMTFDSDTFITKMEELGESMDGEAGIGLVTIEMEASFMRTDIDSVGSIAAPASATVVPIAELMGGMMGQPQ